jgi:tripartite-type tricarboxylate transporter receptor subunit TctC
LFRPRRKDTVSTFARIARIARIAVLLLVTGLVGPHVAAQTGSSQGYPNKPIKVIVPFGPGGVTDIMARTVGEKLSASWGQPMIIENRPGAGGTIGTNIVAKAQPDGYTLAVVSSGHVVNHVFYGTLPYDTIRDFAGVIPLGYNPTFLVVSPALGVKSAQELIALAKARPGKLNYVSAGVGSAAHMGVEKFRVAAGIDAVHIPLKSGGEMVTELMSGRVQFAFTGISVAGGAMKAGKIVALATCTARRSTTLPDLPTCAEAGVRGAEYMFWNGMLAPAKTPRDIVAKLNAEIARLVQLPEMRERLAQINIEPLIMTPDQFDASMREEFATIGPIMKAAGVKAN